MVASGWAELVTRSGDIPGLREARRYVWDTSPSSGEVASPGGEEGEAGKGQEASAQGRCH